MKLVYIIIIFLISFCSTQTKEELKDSKVVKKAQKVNQNLPLGLRPCKEYLNEDADPFRITFEKLGVPYQEPKLNSKRELEVKFKYKLFDVHLLKDSSGFFENYKYKNKEFFFSFYETSEYYYCSLTNYYEENPKQYFSLEYSIHKAFRYEKFKNAIQIICQGKESDWIKERITYKSPIYDFDGKIIYNSPGLDNVKGCKSFSIWPYLKLGKYFVKVDKVRIRENPTTKSKIIAELNKNTELEVVEDTGIIEEIGNDVAPWGKVKLKNGKEGYIFGSLIKEEGFFWD